jgi:WD40 repeat protein/two-component sensor histidine kinase
MVPWSLIIRVVGLKAPRGAVPFAWIVGLMSVGVPAPLASGAGVEIVLQRGAAIEALAAAFSPDGRLIAASGQSDTIRLWDPASGDLVGTLPGHSERVMDVKFSPDGRLLASSSTDGTVKLWDYREGKLLRLFTNHVGNWVRRVAFSPDGRWLVPASYDGKVSVWDTANGTVARTLPMTGRVGDILFTPDGRQLITGLLGNASPLIQFWDVATGKPGLALQDSNAVWSLAITQDGRLLASAGGSDGINLWELPAGRWLRQVQIPEKTMRHMSLSPDGRLLAVAGEWVNMVIAADTGALVAEQRGHEDTTFRVCFSPDGGEVASASGDASVRLWGPRNGRTHRIFAARPPDVPITSLAFSADGVFEAVGGVDGVVRVWDARSGAFRHNLRGHEGAVQALAFSLESDWMYSGGADRTTRLWDMSRGTVSGYLPFFDRLDAIGAVACGGSEGYFASASGSWGRASLDHSIKIWQPHFDRPKRALRGHTASVRAIAYAPRGDVLASASIDGTVKLWNTRQAQCLQTLTNAVFTEVLAFAPDASWVLAGMADGTVRVLDPNSLATTRSWQAHQRPVQSIAFNADGRWLATASLDRTVALWDFATGRELRRFTNVTSQFLPLAFHPKKPVLAFALRDELVVHADVETGEVLFQRAHFPDGEWLAWNPTKAFYMSSPRGHEHARLRLADQLVPVYPLELYSDELSRPTNLFAALAGPAPVLVPKNFRLWWHRYPYKQPWVIIGATVLLLWVASRLRHGWIADRRRRAQELFSRQLLAAHETERKRIAAELHDGLGQNLLVIKNRLFLAQLASTVSVSGPASLQEISQIVSHTIEEVRGISHNLRPYQLDRLGLTKALLAVVKGIADSGALLIETDVQAVDGLFNPEGEIHIYRVVQECLNNIVKHSDAAVARVFVQKSGEWLTMRIEDDGRGFDYRPHSAGAAQARGFGLTGLGERMRILGGRFQCDSAPGQGTRMKFEIPIPTKHE